MSASGFDKKRVLVVDDFDNFRVTVMRMLQEFGAKVVDTAVNGSDALRKCRASRYDLVLCDYNLGPGKSGQQVLEQLRYEQLLSSSTLFVLISAESSKDIVMAAYDYEPDAYLTKPITTKTLQQRLERLFRQRHEMRSVYQAVDEGNTSAAIERCRALIDSASRYRPTCQKLLGRLLLQSEDYTGAEALYREVLESRDLDWAQVGLAAAKKGQNDWLAAQQWTEQALATSDMSMRAYDLLASIHEARGDFQAQQKTLERAVDISPLSVTRQQSLGELAFRNQDLDVAAKAFKNSVKLGENSCFDDPNVHLQFVRSCAELARRDPEQAKSYERDVNKTLSQFEHRFGGGEDNRVLARSAACAYKAASGNESEARQLLDDAIERAKDSPVDLGVRLDWVSAYDAMGETQRRDRLIDELLHEYQSDQAALERIDRLLENPASDKNRKRVAQINKSGIAHYEKAEFDQAVAYFEQAAKEFPKHVGIELNLLQASIGLLEQGAASGQQLEQAQRAVAKLDAAVGAQHPQATRFAQLKAKLRELANQFSDQGTDHV